MVLATVKEAWQPLRSQWLGERVLLAFEDASLRGVSLRQGAIHTQPWVSMLPAQALERGMPDQIDVLGDFLGDLLLSMDLGQQALRIALPPQAAHWRVITWPLQEWPDEPIAALRTIDPELGLPFDLADAVIDVQPLPGKPLQALLVAAPRLLVEAWITVLNIAGLTLERLVPSQVCLRTALLPALQALNPANGVLLLQAEADQTCLVQLWQQGVPRYERRLLSDDEALSEQLQTLLAFYASRDPGFAVGQLWLTAPLPQQDELAASLQLPIELIDASAYGSLVLQGLAQLR